MVARAFFGHADGIAPRILIVDDSPHFVATAHELLTARGLEVCGRAQDGDVALALARKATPDGVLLDINLPVTDGYSVAASLSAQHPGITILLTSSDTDEVSQKVLEECGATEFVPKTELAAADLGAIFGQPFR